MTIQQVLQALDGRPDLCATRPTGKMIQITKVNKLVQRTRHGTLCSFTPNRGDLVTDDWQVKTPAMIAKEVEAMMAEAEAAELAQQQQQKAQGDGAA